VNQNIKIAKVRFNQTALDATTVRFQLPFGIVMGQMELIKLLSIIVRAKFESPSIVGANASTGWELHQKSYPRLIAAAIAAPYDDAENSDTLCHVGMGFNGQNQTAAAIPTGAASTMQIDLQGIIIPRSPTLCGEVTKGVTYAGGVYGVLYYELLKANKNQVTSAMKAWRGLT